jgi:hypothetical protein
MFYGSLLVLFVADLVTELWALGSLIHRVKCGPFLEFYWLAVHLWVVFFFDFLVISLHSHNLSNVQLFFNVCI